jgi:hypothetical protein
MTQEEYWTGARLSSPRRVVRSLSLLCVLPVLFFGRDAEAQTIDPKDLENIKVGELVRVSDLLKKKVDAVCVLRPYQDSLYGSTPIDLLVNAYLKKINYREDEGHWAFIFLDDDKVTMQRFARSERLDIASGDASLPRKFKAVACASAAQARVIKLPASNRTYLIFGEPR